MKRKHMKNAKSLSVLFALAVSSCQIKAYAVGNTTEGVVGNATGSATENVTERVAVSTESSEIISVELPVVEERNPFNFFIDPLHIFYNTFGSSGGDITVEENTSLLFYNCDEGEYTLSSRSDDLKIINKSTVPVEVTVTAKIENADGITVMQNKEFTDRSSCDLYLALVDNEGNEQPLSEDGEASIIVKLDRAPLDAYAYVLNEDTGEYQYAYQSEDIAFDTYSFGLMGACNEKGDWVSISGRPHVTISWNVEPVVPEEPETGEEPEEKPEDIMGSSVSDDDVPDKDGESMGEHGAEGEEDPPETEVGDTEGSISEDDISDGKGTTEDSGSGADSSGADETKGEAASGEEDQNMGDQGMKDEEDPPETVAGDTEVPVSEDGVPDDKGTMMDSGSESNNGSVDEEEGP